MTTRTGTTSMAYNPFTQRGWVAEINSKRDIALENLREDLTTKYAELFWSNATPVTIPLVHPGNGNNYTLDIPGPEALNVFDPPSAVPPGPGPPSTAPLVNKTTSTGYCNIYSPTTSVFQFTNSNGSGEGTVAIKYVAAGQQLCEITGEVVLGTPTTDARKCIISIYVNDKLVNTQLRSVSLVDSASGNDLGVSSIISFNTTLTKGDLVKLVAWRGDGSADGSAGKPLNLNLAKLFVKTLP